MINHTEFLMEYVKKKRALPHHQGTFSYLEIGCFQNQTFDNIDATYKVGVDPASGGTHRMTSDAYFASIQQSFATRFDLVFIDGLHEYRQVQRDIDNSIRHLSISGLIVLHDVLPPDASYCSPSYCGDAWRAFLKAHESASLELALIPADYGVGLVRFSREANAHRSITSVEPAELSYEDYIRDCVPKIKQLSWQEGLVW